MRDSISSETKN